MTMVQTLEVIHGLMSTVKVVMNGMRCLLSWSLSFKFVVLVDGKASMDGIRKALGMLLPSSGIVLAEI